MKIDRDMIASLIKAYESIPWQGNEKISLAEFISREIEKAQETEREIAGFNEETAILFERQAQERIAIQMKLVEIRKRCPHSWVSHHRDPSGGNDSFRQCNICGKENP